MKLMTKETIAQLLLNIERSNIDIELIRSFQLDTATVKIILTHYKKRIVEEMKTKHPEIYRAFQDNKQAFKLANGKAIFEESLANNQLSKVDQLSVNHQTNRIIYNLDLLIKTPNRYMTIFDLYKRTKTTSFVEAVNQNTLHKLEGTLISQLQQLHHYYQEIKDGMIEIDQVREPTSTQETLPKLHPNSSSNPISEAAQHLFEKISKKKRKEPVSGPLVSHKTTQISKITAHDINGVAVLYLETIGHAMKNKYPKIYAAYQNNYCNFSTTKGSGNIFHQLLFNERLNKNTLPAEAEELLNINIKKVMTGISSLIKNIEQYARFHDMYERIKKVHGLPKEDALIDLEKKLSATVTQSKNITTDIMEGLKQIDSLDKQYQEQSSLLNSKQIDYLISSKLVSVDLTPPPPLKDQQNKISSDSANNRAASNASFKKSLSDIKATDPEKTLKQPSFKS